MTLSKNIDYSKAAIILIFIVLFSIFFSFDLWRANRITLDAPSYYTYLPAIIIHNDLDLVFIDADPDYYKDKIWFYRIENGEKLIKHPMGISLALSPFFIIGHFIAKISGSIQDGYSLPYQNAVSLGVFIYLFTGLYFLRKLLLQFFPDNITALTIISIFAGSNLLWYSTFEILMPHAVSFSLVCICLYTFINWLNTARSKHLLLFALALGLSVLIRPLAITFLVFFLLYGIISKGGINYFYQFMRLNIKSIIPAALISIVVASLQLFYWKHITGQWFYDPYVGEHFIFSENKILPFLFGFRKGLFIYSPVLIFFIIGLIIYYRKNKAFFYSIFSIFIISVFIFSSWWAWSYGISWGVRPMIDYYPLMAIPMALAFHSLYKRKIAEKIMLIVVSLFIALNLFQTWQYKNGLIHYDDMTRDAYFKGFFQIKPNLEWNDRLKPYDWERRKKGLPQIKYSKDFILDPEKSFYITGPNLLYLSVNPRAQNALASYIDRLDEHGLFYFEKLNGDTVSIQSANELLLTINTQFDNVITATGRSVGNNEKFIFEYIHEGNNLIALKSLNGNYISMNKNYPHTLHASKNTRGINETFRIFLYE